MNWLTHFSYDDVTLSHCFRAYGLFRGIVSNDARESHSQTLEILTIVIVRTAIKDSGMTATATQMP